MIVLYDAVVVPCDYHVTFREENSLFFISTKSDCKRFQSSAGVPVQSSSERVRSNQLESG